jgi:glycosyltransferase involved in cell wall biosynthesis
VGLARVVAETGAGLVVDGDPAKLGAAIAALLADPDRRRRMGEAGRAAAEQQFSWDAVAQQMEALYQDLIGAAARKPWAEMMAANE